MTAHHYPALGFDPAPGDCWAIGRLSRDADRLADELFTATVKVQQLGAASWCWQGEAATEFAAGLGQLPRWLGEARRAFRVTATALLTYRDTLLDQQVEARRAEADAQEALHRLHAATGGLYRSHPDYRYPGAPARDDSVVRLGDLTSPSTSGAAAATLAQQDLDAARAWGRRIAERTAAEAGVAAEAVRRATEFAPPVPGLLQRMSSGVGDWVRDNADLVSLVADVATVAGLAVLIFSGGWLIATLVAAVGVAATGALARYADGSKTDVVLAAAGMATGGLAGLVGHAAKGARAGALGQPVRSLPSLWDDAAGTAAELPWRVAMVQLDMGGLGLGVYGSAGVARRWFGPAPPPRTFGPQATRPLPPASAATQFGRRPTPRRLDEPSPARTAQLDRAAAGAASGW